MLRINKAHPWHGIKIGENTPREVTVFIEIVPSDTVKYEVDKETGYLKIDRPQQYSNVVPAKVRHCPCSAPLFRSSLNTTPTPPTA